MALVAERTGRVVMDAFHYRYHPLAGAPGRDRLERRARAQWPTIEAAMCFPLVQRSDIRYDLALAGGALMDAGCYPVHLLRTLAGGEPTVVSARAKLASPGLDRAMEADFELEGGGRGRIVTSLWSSHVLAVNARVAGEAGQLRVLNPFAPQHYHRLVVTAGGGKRVEHLTKEATYDFQLRAFVAAVHRRRPAAHGPGRRHRQHEGDRRRLPGGRARAPAAHALSGSSLATVTELDALRRRRRAGAALEAARRRLGCSHAEVRVERIRSQVRARCATAGSRRRPTTPRSGVGRAGRPRRARSASPPRSAVDAGRRRRAGRRRPWRPPGPPRRPAGGPSSWPPSRPTARSTGRRPTTSTRSPCPWPRRWPCWRTGAAGCLGAAAVDHVTAYVLAVSEDKHFADLAGTVATQRRVRIHPSVEAMAVGRGAGLRDHAHPGPAGRPGLGVPRRARAGTGRPSWPPCPSCWPRSWPRRRSRPAPTTW